MKELIAVYDSLNRIKALCENPHWTNDRKYRIIELVHVAITELNRMPKDVPQSVDQKGK